VSASKQLARDSLNHVYAVITRYKELVETFDDRKERLYKYVRKIFESYKPANAKSSWLISGKGLLAIADEDRKVMAATRQKVTVDSTFQINTNEIQKMSRDLITNEYANLTGIEKLGRYNGNCPYTPYEYMATYSKSFAESMDEIDKKMDSDYNRHPYNDLVHTYNQSLVYNYNKFAELSKVPLLKTVMQLQLFEIIPPKKPAPRKIVEPALPSVVEVYTPENVEPEVAPVVAVSAGISGKQKRKSKDEKPVVSDQPVSGGVVHDTVRITDIIRIETVRQDTVFVSKVDTVFVGIPGDMNMSMEGYATNNMVLLLDVSGSMNTPEKLPLLKQSVLDLLSMMRQEDQVSIIAFSGKPKALLEATSFKEEQKIKSAISDLKSSGKTDGNAGVKLAYKVADENYIRGGNNRIILATDGEFGLSDETRQLIGKFSKEDIFLTVFNFGKGAGSSKALERLADLGKGNYRYISKENVDLHLIGEAKAKKKK